MQPSKQADFHLLLDDDRRGLGCAGVLQNRALPLPRALSSQSIRLYLPVTLSRRKRPPAGFNPQTIGMRNTKYLIPVLVP